MISIDPIGVFDPPSEWFSQDIYQELNTDLTPEVVIGVNVHYAVQIDISDNTDIADEIQIGLFNDALLNGGSGGSAFRWVTERPDYDGSIVVPTGELPTANATKWGEGMITSRGDLGAPVRLINVNIAGNYGSLSGFQFSVDNVRIEGGAFDGELFFDVLEDNSMFLLNRKVRFYIIIDNAFFNVWSGIVSKLEHDETRFSVTCEDDFKNVHKTLPPQIANEKLFPKILSKSVSKPIPVSFGFNNHAKLLNIFQENDTIGILTGADGVQYRLAPIQAYDEPTKKVTINTGSKIFVEDELKGLYIRHIIDGDGQTVKIISHLASQTSGTGNTLALILESKLTQTPVLRPTDETALQDSSTKFSHIEIFDFESAYIVSNFAIDEYKNSPEGIQADLSFFDNERKEFDDASEILDLFSETDISLTGFPGISGLTKAIDYDGNFIKQYTFKAKNVFHLQERRGQSNDVTGDFGPFGTSLPNLFDRSSATKNTITIDNTTAAQQDFHFAIKLVAPDNLKKIKFDKLYVVVDFDFTVTGSPIDAPTAKITIRPIDSLDKLRQEPSGGISWQLETNITSGVKILQRMIPPNYFNLPGDNTAFFETNKDAADLTEFWSDSVDFRTFPAVSVSWSVSPNIVTPPPLGTFSGTVKFDVFEIAFVVEKIVNIITQDLFVKVSGEKIGSEDTANVHNIFESILKTYDGIAAADIDLSGISVSRKTWVAGRQLTQRKSSFNYLKQLAQQSFVGIFPSRIGKRALVAFRDTETASASTIEFSHDNGNILKDSISRFELSPINEIYNEFDIKYEFIEAGNRFDKSIFIKNVDEATGLFPNRFLSTDSANDKKNPGDFTAHTLIVITIEGGSDEATALLSYASVDSSFAVGKKVSLDDSAGIGIIEFADTIEVTSGSVTIKFKHLGAFTDGDNTATGIVFSHAISIPQWTTFAGGFSSYNQGKKLWDICKNSFDRTRVIRQLPAEYSDCKWYPDEGAFTGVDPGQSATVHKYLELLVEWATRQKEIVEFSIPITTVNVKLELLEFHQFRDQKYTANELRIGYITKVKPIPRKDEIILEMTLIPADIESATDCLIVESGLNTDTIVETGSNTDTIVETGTC